MARISKIKKFTKGEPEITYKALSAAAARVNASKRGRNRTVESILLDVIRRRKSKGLEPIYPQGAASLIVDRKFSKIENKKKMTEAEMKELGEKQLRVFSAGEVRVIESMGMPSTSWAAELPDEMEKLRIRAKISEPDFKKVKSSLALKGIALERLFAKEKK